MKLLAAFSNKAPNKVFFSVLAGCAAGICYSILIPMILATLQPTNDRFKLVPGANGFIFGVEVTNVSVATIFAATCAFIFLCRAYSQVTLKIVAMRIASDLRVSIYRRVSLAPLVALERAGTARLITALTSDVSNVVNGARVLPDIMISSITILGVLGFLLCLNADVLWFLLGCITFGIVSYQLPILLGHKYLIRAGASLDILQEATSALIRGTKELKLNAEKNREFFESVLLTTERDFLRAQRAGSTLMSIAGVYGELLIFAVIGAMVFVFSNYRPITVSELVGATMALLYIAGPIATLLNLVPQLAVAQVSLGRVTALLTEIPDENVEPPLSISPPWEIIRFDNVVFHHQGSEGSRFCVGPVNFEIQKGKITFIVGGNGSGKSTLSRLATLHYTPESGSIWFGSECIDRTNISSFRQTIAAVYSDYYLFDRIFSVRGNAWEATVDHYLRVLQLDGKVTFKGGRFSTLALSDGQRRRLALLVAIVEDKEFYLFDEWAADQDPEFKRVFYFEILPALRVRGKAVVAVTHDDRFFEVADSVLVMSDGILERICDSVHAGAASRPSIVEAFSLED